MKPKLLLLWLLLLMGAAGAQAQKAYAMYDSSSKRLTFYYDNTSHAGTRYNLNTGSNAPGWASIASSVLYVVFDSSFQNARPASCCQWFNGMQKLLVITGLQYLNTSEVTNMQQMFYDCKKVTSLNLGDFYFSESCITTQMLANCTALKYLSVSSSANLLSSDACDGVGASEACRLDYPEGFTPDKIDLENWCYKWKNGTFIDRLRPYALYNDTDHTLTFYYDKLADQRSGTALLMNKPGYVPSWFSFRSNISRVAFDSSFIDARPTTCYYWFYGMTKIVGITGLQYLNTSEVTNMYRMFAGSSSLTSLNVTRFNTSKVTNMEQMFSGCSRLTSLDIHGFTIPADSCNSMLYNCSSLKMLSVPATAGNLASSACTGVGTQEEPCTLVYPDGFTPEKTSMGDGWFQWKGGYFKDVEPYVTLSGTQLTFFYDGRRALRNITTYDLNEGHLSPGWSDESSTITKVVFDSSFAKARPTTCSSWFSGMSNLTTITGISNLNTSEVTIMDGMFFNCSSLDSLDVSHFNTEKVTSMGSMFSGCSALTALDVSGFNTSEVTEMAGMFSGCSSLTSLDVSHFDTSKVYAMILMFSGCSSLTEIDVSHFNVQNTQVMGFMFQGCSSLESLDLSSFENIPDTYYDDETSTMFGTYMMLYGCSALKMLTIPAAANNLSDNACSGVGSQDAPCNLFFPDGFTPQKTATGDGWYKWKNGYFRDAPELKPYVVLNDTTLTFYYDRLSLDRSGTVFDLNEGSDMPGWYDYFYRIRKVVLDASFAEARPTSCAYWFYNLVDITEIEGLENLVTTEVTNMLYMFGRCLKLKSLDVSTFTTDKVTEMSYMFYECESLETLSLDTFDTKNVGDMVGMFKDCTSLTDLSLPDFNTQNVYSMVAMFENCSSLTTLNIQSFTITQYDNGIMFAGCTSLRNLLLPGTANRLAANACNGVGTPDNPCFLFYPDNFTPDNTTTGEGYFGWRSGYFRDGYRPYVELSDSTLNFCFDKLSWRCEEKGHPVFELNNDNELPGWYNNALQVRSVYFFPEFKNARPTTTFLWFNGMKNLLQIEHLDNLNTSEVTNMRYMFQDCKSLKSLDVSNFNTEKVAGMSYMFDGCTSLETLTGLTSFNTSNVVAMYAMFNNCTSLTELEGVDGFNMDDVITCSRMFRNCSSLEHLLLGDFHIPRETSEMMVGCTSLQTLAINPVTTNYELSDDACVGIGTPANPCTLVTTANITPDESYDSYFKWKGGYFCHQPYPMGDVNHDGQVNITDVTLTVDYVLVKHPSPFFIENADVSPDGIITISDVTAIVNILLNN